MRPCPAWPPLGTTRSAAALELWRPHLAGSVVAIGNAPTALFHLLTMLEDPACPRPAAMIGCPVGFVGAVDPRMRCGPGAGALLHRGGAAGRQRDHRGGDQRPGERRGMSGTIHGVGLGPGAADLMSVRADRLVRGTRHIAYFRKAGRPGHARRIAADLLRPDAVEIAMEYPVTTEIPVSDPRYNACLAAFYADCTQRLADLARAGERGRAVRGRSVLLRLVHAPAQPPDRASAGAGRARHHRHGRRLERHGLPITWGDDV
jgi:hypothetical protein